MFKQLRRQDRALSYEESKAVLRRAHAGTLALSGGDYPYAVPLNFVTVDNNLYFHGALESGEGAERVAQNPRACFSVFEQVEGARCNSVMCFGVVDETPEMAEEVLEHIVEKYVPPFAWPSAKAGIPKRVSNVRIFRFRIEHLTGKFVDKPAS